MRHLPLHRRLLLHIGHSKTGSSYMQSALALSHEALAEAGIIYPVSGNFERAKNGNMTNGNGADILEAIKQDAPGLVTPPDDANTVLYSAEHLMLELAKSGGIERLNNVASRYGFDDIKLYLVIRDPTEHLTSEFSQKIKGGRLVTLPRMSRQYHHPKAVRDLIETVAKHPHIDLTIQHYRCIKDDLIGALATWLNTPREAFSDPPVPVVNRTLTRDELAFQFELNKRFGRCTNLIAVPLMMGLHDQQGRRPTLGPKPARELLARISPDIRAVNRTLPRAHRYHVPSWWRFLIGWYPGRSARKGGVHLSDEQVRIIVNGLADEIADLRAKAK